MIVQTHGAIGGNYCIVVAMYADSSINWVLQKEFKLISHHDLAVRNLLRHGTQEIHTYHIVSVSHINRATEETAARRRGRGDRCYDGHIDHLAGDTGLRQHAGIHGGAIR